MEVPAQLGDLLSRNRQEHLLHWWDKLNNGQRGLLVTQIEAIDFPLIGKLFAERIAGDPPVDESPASRAERARTPSNLVRLPVSDADRVTRNQAAQFGEQLLAAGKVGVILVAGGQGSRLGFPHPKGMFPIGPVTERTLFQLLAEQLLARSRQFRVSIPCYVMTSESTHDETVAFFEGQNFFGLDADDVRFFQQASMPAVDATTGQILLAEKGRIASSPDGHGGMVAALSHAGLLDEMRQRGVDTLYYHQVDNPTTIVCDPEFLGLHAVHKSEMSTKVVAKRTPTEKMGVVVDVDSRAQIIEYSDLPDELAAKTDDDDQPIFWAGNTAIHAFNREFLERIAATEDALELHVAHKNVPHIDDTGTLVEPTAENAYKFERFIFDALPHTQTALVVETDRTCEFNPVKNATGDDSPETSRGALTAIYRGWLRENGVEVAADADVEISPLSRLYGNGNGNSPRDPENKHGK